MMMIANTFFLDVQASSLSRLNEIQVFFISLLSSFLAESYDDIKIWGNVKQKFGPTIHIFYL